MPVLSLTEATTLVADALQRCRTSQENAELVATALVRAEAEGLKSHGLLRVPMYAAQAKIGKVNGFAAPSIEQPRPGLLAIDAKFGFAYPAMYAAVDLLPEMARACGIAEQVRKMRSLSRAHWCGQRRKG